MLHPLDLQDEGGILDLVQGIAGAQETDTDAQGISRFPDGFVL